jgi:hypothetical protein
MRYRIAGRTTDLCSCQTPCPCAFGQTPTRGTCAGMFCFDIQEGEYENVSLARTRAIFANTFSGGPWMDGNFTAALILDANSTDEQREALTTIFSGKAGGDAANMAALVGDMKGVFVAPIAYKMTTNGEITVRAGDLADAGGQTLRGMDGTSEITVTNPLYPLPTVIAGKSTHSRVSVPGLEFDNHGSGMWTGPFELKG